MNRIILVLLTFALFSCTETKTNVSVETNSSSETNTTKSVKTAEVIPGDFAHTVYFWLKRPDNQEDRIAFETSLKKFINNSPYITTKHIGVPAATNREVIDNTYTYSLLLTFKDKATQDLYQDEPAHKLFIEESNALWSKVLVYDSENQL